MKNARLSLSLTFYLAITEARFSPAVLLFDLIVIRNCPAWVYSSALPVATVEMSTTVDKAPDRYACVNA